MTGWPKADRVSKYIDPEKKEIYKKQIGLNPKKPTILYAPAWENDHKQEDFVNAMLDIDVNILVKQAPFDPSYSELYSMAYNAIQEMYELFKDDSRVIQLDPRLNILDAINFKGVILLGDCIDYGMRSNEIIQKLINLDQGVWKNKIVANIWGNHEKLVVDKDLERLSSDRGRVMAQYTARQLSSVSVDYINTAMNKTGIQEFDLCGVHCLAVHGSLEDNYWKAISPENLRGDYCGYDIVLGGHSHYSHCFTHFYEAHRPEYRNKKAVMFINPGSIGQPRNHNPFAQYAVLSLPSKRVELRAVEYDVEYEQSLFPDEIDEFYKIRLTNGV